jgi:fatty-acyl-CoA synthase
MGFADKDDDPGRGPRVRTGRGAVVVDENGRLALAGEDGWIAKTGSVPIGYYKDPEKSERLFKTFDGKRMVITDDRARVEADGSIALLGRGNMVVNTGGEKVFVEEVESVLKAHPVVSDAVVVGVPHDRWGHQVAAVIAVSAGATLDFVELTAHVRRHLAGYKIPETETFRSTQCPRPRYPRDSISPIPRCGKPENLSRNSQSCAGPRRCGGTPRPTSSPVVSGTAATGW